MATCDMGYEHSDPVPEPEPVPVIAEPGPNENDVKIAEIEADARVETEKLWTGQRAQELESEVSALRGELRGMREVLDQFAPPEPVPAEPVVIPVPEPAPAPAEPAAALPETTPPKPEKKSRGYWG